MIFILAKRISSELHCKDYVLFFSRGFGDFRITKTNKLQKQSTVSQHARQISQTTHPGPYPHDIMNWQLS